MYMRINLGAGRERFKGWKSLDLPPEENVSFKDPKGDITLTPDIVSRLPSIPVPSRSVDMLRTKDLLMDYQMLGSDYPIEKSMSLLGHEIRRVLKRGGRLITIEHPSLSKAFSPYLRIVSIVPGATPHYLKGMSKEEREAEGIEEEVPGGRFLVTTYVKD